MDATWIAALAASPWLLVALFVLVVGDAFLVVLPSETLVVALGALAATTGEPSGASSSWSPRSAPSSATGSAT